MPVDVSLLRAVNVGGRGSLRMDALRELYASLGFEEPRSYVQSGNIVFRSIETDKTALATKIERAIAKKFAITTTVILRTAHEFRGVVSSNPYVGRPDVAPNKLIVNFLLQEPSAELRETIEQLAPEREEIHVVGREIYLHFPLGSGQSKLPALLDRVLKSRATGRNWTTVSMLLAMAETMEG